MPRLDELGATPLALEIGGIRLFKCVKQLVLGGRRVPDRPPVRQVTTPRKDEEGLEHARKLDAAPGRPYGGPCDKRVKEAYNRARKAHPHRAAIPHVSNKMLTIVWHMLQNGTTYGAKKDEIYAGKPEAAVPMRHGRTEVGPGGRVYMDASGFDSITSRFSLFLRNLYMSYHTEDDPITQLAFAGSLENSFSAFLGSHPPSCFGEPFRPSPSSAPA